MPPAPRVRPRTMLLAATVLGCLCLAASPTAADAHPAATPAKAPVMKGVVVDSATRHSIKGVVVTARDPGTLELIGSDLTNASGAWEIDGLTSDEYAVKVNGARKGYETGYLGCSHGVVADFGDACTFAVESLGRARLDRL